jgi:hypothetical protein
VRATRLRAALRNREIIIRKERRPINGLLVAIVII